MTPSLRFSILRRDGFRCRYCGASAPNVCLEVDHVVPRSRGGTDDPRNLVTACVDCNAGKSAQRIITDPPPVPVWLTVQYGATSRPAVLLSAMGRFAAIQYLDDATPHLREVIDLPRVVAMRTA